MHISRISKWFGRAGRVHHRYSRWTVLAPLISLLMALHASAVNPSLGNILPRGGQRGAEVQVTLSGANLADASSLLFHDSGISLVSLTAENDTTVQAVLSVAPDCRVGTHAVRLATRTGVSNLKLFSVGNLPEIQELEPNTTPEEAAPLEIGTTVNGVITSEDVDYFAVELAQGERLAVEAEGLRLGDTLFDPKLRLFGPMGHELAAEDDTQVLRQDAGFVYTAHEAGRHLVAISEAAYGGSGNCYYRLHVGRFPRPLSVIPYGAPPGSTVDVTWLGDPGLVAQTVTVPESASGTIDLSPASESGVAPTGIPFRATAEAGVIETEPNNEPGLGTLGQAPGAFHGVIAEAGDVDYFQFNGTANQTLDLRVWARALGSPLDSVLTVFDPAGASLGADDDAAGIDSTLRVTLPADGLYTLSLRDHLNRGGEAFAYRVEAAPVAPALSLSVLENKPVSVTVPQGNQSFLLVSASRKDFDGPLRVTLPDLPAGLSAESEILPAGQTTVPVLISAAPDSAVGAALCRLTGALDPADQPIAGDLHQEVVLVYGINETTFFPRDVDRLALAVSEPAPFNVTLVQPQAPLVRRSSRTLSVKVTRAEGFTGPIDLRFPWLPTGMGGGTAKIAEGEEGADIRLEVRADAAEGEHKLFVAASGAGYQLCTPLTPIQVEEQWITLAVNPAETDQGKPVEVVVTSTPRKVFEGSFPISLAGLPKGVTAEPLQLSHETTELRFTLNVAEDAPEGRFNSMFANTILEFNGEPLQHSSQPAELKIYKPLPAELQAQAPPPPPPPAEGAPEAPVRKTRFPTT